MYCPHCGHIGIPKIETPGTFAVELLLWVCFLLPGLAYTLWRLARRRPVCPRCGTPHMIPRDTPRAVEALGPVPAPAVTPGRCPGCNRRIDPALVRCPYCDQPLARP
jgi:hypothetical protein